ncbi:MAG: M23 family metallopeptidase [Clostridia bacterium]|nr:M23 family metallopeptidase [Clostridia bacterium]
MKKTLIHVKRSIKFIILLFIATCLIVGAFAFFYKPIYSVKINGEPVGYSSNKAALQAKINQYMEKGSEKEKNIAFVQIDKMPEYSLCLLKKGIVANDDEIFEKVKASGTTYYKYFAILESDEEKFYVSDFETAEAITNELKQKSSSNIDEISIIEKYETELKEFSNKETVVAKLFQAPRTVSTKVAKNTSSNRVKASGSVNTSLTTSGQKVSLGISLARPVSGTITSRFGAKSSLRKSTHTGLDIAAPSGTSYAAAAAGTVSFAGYKGSYGNLIVITHSNGVQTYYGHSSKIYVSAGESVSQGQAIGAVGSTGNSTGPHLHFEVRVNGVAYNPQNYVY